MAHAAISGTSDYSTRVYVPLDALPLSPDLANNFKNAMNALSLWASPDKLKSGEYISWEFDQNIPITTIKRFMRYYGVTVKEA